MKNGIVIAAMSLISIVACGGGGTGGSGGSTSNKEIHGLVRNAEGKPVSDVAVNVQGSNLTALTDENGQFLVPFEDPSGNSSDNVVLEFDQNNDDVHVIPIGLGPIDGGNDDYVGVEVVVSEGQVDLCSVSVSNQDLLTNTDIPACSAIIDPLPTIQCSSDDACGQGQFCSYTDNSCGGGAGICKEIPKVCNALYGPVCSCDGVTYGNACEADAAGKSIVKNGEC